MRRADRQVSDPLQIEAIIKQARVCHLGLQDQPAPYVVPLSFGYQQQTLYFHAARDGRKVDLIRRNPQAGFTISIDQGDVAGGDQGCEWSVKFQSVVGHGKVSFIENPDEKRAALDLIMAQYAAGQFSYPDKMIERTLLFKLEIETISGKDSSA